MNTGIAATVFSGTSELNHPIENWDDDFVFNQASTSTNEIQPRVSASSSDWDLEPPQPRQLQEWAEKTPTKRPEENWDDDYEDSPRGGKIEEDRSSSPKRTRHDAYPEDSSDEEEFGFAMGKDEDRTVTARSRRRPTAKLPSPPPPVPALPQSLMGTTIEPFPRSPTASVFSVPTSTVGRNSIGTYMSTSHIPLRNSGGQLSMLPPSPPIHRERRRLRKKSRPPHVYDNVFELSETDPTRPTSPARTPSPSPVTNESLPSSPASKGALLSRIGSVKKWGVRKKRASTGPAADYDITATPRPPSSSSNLSQNGIGTANSKSTAGWFFRSGGGGDAGSSPPDITSASLKKEKSINQLRRTNTDTSILPENESPTPSPSKLTKRRPSRLFEQLGLGLGHASPNVNGDGEDNDRPLGRRPGKRHVSDGSTSVGRSASNTLVGASVEDLGLTVLKEESGKRFLGVRRISLGGKHRRNKSGGGIVPIPLPTQVAEQVTDIEVDELLPPIELQPPSPPRVISPTPHTTPTPPSDAPSSPKRLTPRSPGKSPGSPQSASLGRSAIPNIPSMNLAGSAGHVPRRNSLGDLKIPARISQAQVSLRRDLGMVRDFAASVERMFWFLYIFYVGTNYY